jgi:hypothetical protein
MNPVTTSIDIISGGVVILWSAPNSNYDTITAYNVEILNDLGTIWSNEVTNCNGANSIILANLQCVIPMSVF